RLDVWRRETLRLIRGTLEGRRGELVAPEQPRPEVRAERLEAEKRERRGLPAAEESLRKVHHSSPDNQKRELAVRLRVVRVRERRRAVRARGDVQRPVADLRRGICRPRHPPDER